MNIQTQTQKVIHPEKRPNQSRVPSQCIKGIQRVKEMWRIYMDNEEDRLSLLVQGLVLRDRQTPLHSQNPYNPGRTQPYTIRIKVKKRATFLR